VFERGANFYRIRCEGSGIFNGAQFSSPFKPEAPYFSLAHFGGDLSFWDTHFAGPPNLSWVRIGQGLILTGSRFEQEVALRGATVGVLVIEGDTFPFKRANLDLRECNFERFVGEKETAAKLAWAQDPSNFSRDPYLQLEKYYASIGDEVEAKRVHYRGPRDLRANAKDELRGSTRWTRFTSWGDWWLKWLTGYGVRTWLLLVWISAFLIAGTVVFWSDNALESTASAPPSEPAETEVGEGPSSFSATNEGQSPTDLKRKLFDRAAYSLDLFLPVVNLHIDEKWEPQGLGREVYALVHSMVGWLLVPLLVASLAGIVRRQ
jgi:hypothetical protein